MSEKKATSIDECLFVDPFEGDESDVVVVSDTIVTGRKDYPHCQICHGPIAKGEQHRARAEINREENKRMTFRFCNACCVAMIESDNDDEGDDGDYEEPGARLAARYVIGEAARKAITP